MSKKFYVGETLFSVERVNVFLPDGFDEEDRFEVYADANFMFAANRTDALVLYRLLGQALGVDDGNPGKEVSHG